MSKEAVIATIIAAAVVGYVVGYWASAQPGGKGYMAGRAAGATIATNEASLPAGDFGAG